MTQWKANLRAIADACASWLRGPALTQYEAELKKSQNRICGLEALLEETQKENRRLKGRLEHQRAFIAPLLQKSDAELRDTSAYYCAPSKDGRHWEVVTEYCCLGGCDMGIYPFERERDALLFAALLTALGHKPSHNTACSDCYAEYMRDCV